MEIVEERTIGASLGAENIKKGVDSTLWGFAAVALFMVVYYRLMGVFSVIALVANILLLVAALSFLGATLTLPGIAAMALTLGMAIDSNVLINERIREELRDGAKPQAAIFEGYKHAWDTIVDSNITSLIAGIALLLFGSGPVRGFAGALSGHSDLDVLVGRRIAYVRQSVVRTQTQTAKHLHRRRYQTGRGCG